MSLTVKSRRLIAVVPAVALVLVSIVMPAWAWGRYRSAGAETNVFSTRLLVVLAQPTCSGVGLLSVTLSWSQPSDVNVISGYEISKGPTGGPYTPFRSVAGKTTTTDTFSVSSGESYYVVSSVTSYQWQGSPSPERHVHGILGLAATCP